MNRIISIVTARSGSKGLPNKNISVVGDKNLIEHAVHSAFRSKLIDEVYISTDSLEYEDIAKQAGALSLGLRKSELSTDSAKTIDVLLDFCESLNLDSDDILVLLQPTSPIRSGALIDEAIAKTQSNGESSVTVAKIDEPHPFKLKVIRDSKLYPFLTDSNSELPRQSLPQVYQLTGAVYVSTVGSLREKGSLFSSHTNPVLHPIFANVDNLNDLEYLQYLVLSKKVNL